MRRALAARINKLEAARKPVVRIPCVLHVAIGESQSDALARFRAAYPGAPRGHRLLIVPERIRTAEDRAWFDVAFKLQQERSHANARSRQPQENI